MQQVETFSPGCARLRAGADRGTRRGATLVWATVTLLILVAVATLVVDWGRVALVKNQMQAAADAIALSAAARLGTDGVQAAKTTAERIRKANLVDNKAPAMTKLEINTSGTYPTVRVELERSDQHGGAVPLMVGQAFGMKGKTVRATAVARVIPEIKVQQTVLGTANPFLSGMPKGTQASENRPPYDLPDVAGDINSTKPADWKQSPLPVKGLPLIPGQALTFDNIAGQTRHDPSLPTYQPDGQTGENGIPKDIGHNTKGSEHGIADITCPINALVGVFLGPDQPNKTPPPPSLDASSPEFRNRLRFEPQLKQIFFIGDGRAQVWQDGKQVLVPQEFVVPPGATRLFLATWDFYEWNNNGGERVIEISRPQKVELIQ